VEWVEVTAKTVAEAKDKALDLLGVDESQAEFEVLEEPRVGLFRRVKGEGRVRARIKPSHPRPKAERRDRKRRGGRDGSRGDGRSEDRSTGASTGGDRNGGRGRSRSAAPERGAAAGGERRRRETEGRSQVSRTPASADAEPIETVSAAAEPAPVVAGRAPQPSPAPQERLTREEPLSAMTEEDRSENPSDDGRQTEHAVDFLTGLVAAFGLTATVTSVAVDDHYDEVRITGNDLGMLIGPRAGALDSVQELTRVVAQRRSGGRGESRLRVDVAGYRQRRREALERFALKIAEEVKATGTIKALEPMNSADRKVVHDAIGALDGVSTLSEGEDPRRRVVIVPAT